MRPMVKHVCQCGAERMVQRRRWRNDLLCRACAARKASAAMTPEQRSDLARKASAAMTPEQRSDLARKGAEALNAEQRSRLGKLGAAKRFAASPEELAEWNAWLAEQPEEVRREYETGTAALANDSEEVPF